MRKVVCGMIKWVVATVKAIDSSARYVMACGILYSIVLFGIALMVAVANGAGSIDVNILRQNAILAEVAACMFPFSIGVGLLLDYCLKKKA